MSTATPLPSSNTASHDLTLLSRILDEGYGSGAWHGPDLAAAVADVSADLAFRRPAPDRHSIAEIALHHTWCVRGIIAKLGGTPSTFPIEGEDWFPLEPETAPVWDDLRTLLANHQTALREVVTSGNPDVLATAESELLALVLGLTCHAVYHAGQIQLTKRLLGA